MDKRIQISANFLKLISGRSSFDAQYIFRLAFFTNSRLNNMMISVSRGKSNTNIYLRIF